MTLYLYAAGADPVMQFAAEELIQYSRGKILRTDRAEEAQMILESEDSSRLHDSFQLQSCGEVLHIRGSNPRSVLFGVYEYLKSFGYAFLYPGKEGEIIPENPEFTTAGFDRKETASRTFRGLAFRPEPDRLDEGRELISFMAKNRYNLFFMEGYDVERPGDAYSVVDGVHPLQHVEYMYQGKSWEERKAIAEQQQTMVAEARKRGLLVERGGHGWNYGVPEHYAANHGISVEEARARLKAKGKINAQAEVAVSTWFQICLGEEEVREIYAEHILDYLRRHHREMDIAAIWMGDGYDNKCQCAQCLKQPFSDLYLDIFRRVALQARKEFPGLLLECLVYFETLEPPTRNFLEGLDNVVINFAAWRQCYFHHLDDPECRQPDWIPDYRNNCTHDTPNDRRIINFDQYEPCRKWRNMVGWQHPVLVFNYITLSPAADRHFMSYDLTPLVNFSLGDFDRLKIDGMVDCQCHSSWDKPADLMLWGAARILWNAEDCNPAEIRRELFALLFEDRAPEVLEYCDRMSELLLSCGDYHASLSRTPEKADRLRQGLDRMAARLEKLGPLPRGRERYFRESLQALQEQAEAAAGAPQKA